MLDPIVEAGRIQAAHKLREVAVRIVNWAIERDEIDDLEVNLLAPPRGRGKGNGALKRARRDRVLSEPEIRANWMACDLVDPPLFGVLIRALLLLGQRRSEVAGMEWPELDLDRGLWEISASRYKTRLPHVVPLPPPAVELLQELPRVDEVYVFSTEPGTHFSGFSKSMDRLRRLSGTAGWTIHDLRRTARTGMSPLKNAAGHRVGADIAERVLGHVVGGVRGIYDRYAYLDEKRGALDLWAARIGEIVSPPPPNNVIPLARSRGDEQIAHGPTFGRFAEGQRRAAASALARRGHPRAANRGGMAVEEYSPRAAVPVAHRRRWFGLTKS